MLERMAIRGLVWYRSQVHITLPSDGNQLCLCDSDSRYVQVSSPSRKENTGGTNVGARTRRGLW
ncbi:hypothetical protein J6590_026231 [Homalodisca vitripennis]|nr:hypothetical protein J6590_026231 [Homalodisca vitripennis]